MGLEEGEEKLVEAGEDISTPEEMLIQAEKYIELLPKISKLFEEYGKGYADLVKQRKNLLNMLENEQKKIGDLEQRLKDSSSEAEELRKIIASSDEKIREYMTVMHVYDRLLCSARRELDAVTALTEKLAGMDKRWIEITEKVDSLSERNEGLGQTNADLMEVVRQLREENERLGKELSDYKKMPTVEIVEPIPEAGGKTSFPYGQPPTIMQAGVEDSADIAPPSAASLVVGMEGILDISEKTEEPAEEGETKKYDAGRTTKAFYFSTTDAFHYVVMMIYNRMDADKKENSIEAAADYIEKVLVKSLEDNKLDERIIEYTPQDGFAIMKKYFAEIVEYIKQTGEAPQDKLKDVVESCCATVFEMKKNSDLEKGMDGLGIKYIKYNKKHVHELPT